MPTTKTINSPVSIPFLSPPFLYMCYGSHLLFLSQVLYSITSASPSYIINSPSLMIPSQQHTNKFQLYYSEKKFLTLNSLPITVMFLERVVYMACLSFLISHSHFNAFYSGFYTHHSTEDCSFQGHQ